jgi:hypothetical protein
MHHLKNKHLIRHLSGVHNRERGGRREGGREEGYARVVVPEPKFQYLSDSS